MKTKIFTLLLLTGLWSSYKGQVQRKCGSPILSPQYETFVQKWIDDVKQQKSQATNYTLPVIVHVIHQGQPIGTADNISNAQIISQINVLNTDFAGLNADTVLIPTIFKSVFAHSGINFCLAKTDTNGLLMPEPGVERLDIIAEGGPAGPYTTSFINTIIKPNTIWDPTKYLNIWCLDLGNSLLGYATFPDPVSTGVTGLTSNFGTMSDDGVVLKNTAFGSTGSAASPFDKGRTATHEVAHWLGLRHIWGDTICGTDYCVDTPPAQDPNTSCQTHPYNLGTCTGNTTGEMFMNHMDYCHDACLHMFTNDQKARMVAILNGSPMRASLATSTKCNLPAGLQHYSNSIDVKLYPNPNNGEFTLTLSKPDQKTYLEVYDNLGQLISSYLLNETTNKIHLHDIVVGIYQVRIIQNGNTVYRTKIIKN